MPESEPAFQQGVKPDLDRDALLALKSGAFDFLDFGCSRGGSIGLAQTLFGQGRGLGLDIDPDKVDLARNAGHEAMIADLTDLAVPPNLVRFVMLCHFLEHLPGLKMTEKALSSAVRSAREFVYIAQPWFDSDGYLFRRGVKVYWSDWHGHPNRMTTLDFHYLLEDLRRREMIEGYRIFARDAIACSNDAAVHPLASPRNQHHYDETLHPPKPKRSIRFKEPVFSEVQVLIDVRANDAFVGFRAKYPNAQCLFSSYV